MKKFIFIMLFIFTINLLSAKTENKFPFYSKTDFLGVDKKIDTYKILEKDELDYIHKSSLAKLLSEFYLKCNITEIDDKLILEKKDFKIEIDFKNNTVYRYDKNLDNLLYTIYIFEDNYYKYFLNEENNYNLNDYEFQIYEDYFPLILINEIFFDDLIQVYKSPENIYYLFNENNLYEEFMSYYTRKKVIKTLKYSGKLNQDFAEKNLKFFFRKIRENYPGLKSKNIDVDVLEQTYLEKLKNLKYKFKYKYLLKYLVQEFNDDHLGTLTAVGGFQLGHHNKNLHSQYQSDFVNKFKVINNDTLYIKIITFSQDFEFEGKFFKDYIDIINSKKNIIVDIRDNGGGFPYIMENYLSYFSNKDLVYQVKEKNKLIPQLIKSNIDTEKNLIVLINKSCFSASTCFSNIVRLNNAGVLIGETTAGGAYNTGKPFILPDYNVINIPFMVHSMDKDDNDLEDGINPDIFVEDQIVDGKDLILEKALEILEKQSFSHLKN